MALTPGTRIGSYEIAAQIGVGGMGEVYRATDTNLGRQVAIKVLPDAVAQDAERLARFDREARTLAALNHPNIAAIYGLERSEGQTALVMELVDGPTLADRIAEGPVPVDEALAIARQIAEALEAAHEQGIIHRDLKPANIKLRPDGAAKVLDFGLAKAMEPVAAVSPASSQSPTITTPAMTQAGLILGTAAYMSPEQARGRAVDARADVWAFGVLLYEMLTGRRAFQADDVSLTLARVLERDADLEALPGAVPVRVRQLLAICLKKDPRQRLHAIGDARLLLEGALDTAPPFASAPLGSWPVRQLVATLGVGMVAGAAVIAVGVLAFRPGPEPGALSRFDYDVPVEQDLFVAGRPFMALAPNGRHVVYATEEGLYLRSMDSLVARLLPGTLGLNPFFSPDSRQVGFFAGGQLMRVAVTGGAPTAIGPTPGGVTSASWAADGTVFLTTTEGIHRVRADGGTPELVVPVGDAEQFYGPELLPDGETILFTMATGGWDAASLVAQSFSTGERTVLVAGGAAGHYVPTGHLVYALGDSLYGVPFDLDRVQVTSDPVLLVEGVSRPPTAAPGGGGANYGVGANGTLVYARGGRGDQTLILAWIDRQGTEEALAAPPAAYVYPRISPDGTMVALDRRDAQNDIWLWHFAAETLQRFTFTPTSDNYPAWSPDGDRIAWGAGDHPAWQAANGTGEPEIVADRGAPTAFAPDGRLLLNTGGGGSNSDIAVVSMPGESPVESLIAGPFDERNAEVSPDGRWVAYQSDESGQDEIYVQPFPDVTGGKFQVSQGGGSQPLWSRDGAELFYLASQGRVMTVPVETRESFSFGNATVAIDTDFPPGPGGRQYDVSLDGARFLVAKVAASDAPVSPAQLIIVEHWLEELKRLVPTD